MSEPAFEAFVQERWTPLVRTAVFLGCSAPDAEDLVQTVLVQVLRAWPKVTAARDRDAYVYRMLLNAFRRSRERRWRGEVPTETLPDDVLESGSGEVDARVELEALLARLPADQRAVLVLRYVADLSEAQTAAALAVPVGTVKSRTSRALAACQQLMEAQHE